MDVQKIVTKNHTAEEISALWTGYHATRSQGTGRGYLSATIPLKTYLSMTAMALKYPTFLLPLVRVSQEVGHEFYFLEWTMHERPSGCSTVLFTPLQEYKLRQTFAQPYLVLTHYTELASTHDIVLMRGEMTPSLSGRDKYLLSQSDGQLLAVGLQRFYLASGDERRARLLRKFHEKTEEFDWKELLEVEYM